MFMKKYKIKIEISRGMESTPFTEFEMEDDKINEAFQIKKLSTFKDDAYLVFALEEIEEEVSE